VLVPGPWTGAYVWHTVAPLLRAAGHDIYAVTCTGLGERVPAHCVVKSMAPLVSSAVVRVS
jgi:hypothetical protein